MKKLHYCLSLGEHTVSLYPTVAFVIRIKKTGVFFLDFGKNKRLKTAPYLALARFFWTDSSLQFTDITLILDIKKVDYEILRLEIGA